MKYDKSEYDLSKRMNFIMKFYQDFIIYKKHLTSDKSLFVFKCECGEKHNIDNDMFTACACKKEHTFEMQTDPGIHRATPGMFIYQIKKDNLFLWIGSGWGGINCCGKSIHGSMAIIEEVEPKGIKFLYGVEKFEDLGKGYQVLPIIWE